MERVRMSVLRGVCQMPAYLAHDLGLFRARGVEVELREEPTAWAVPERLERGQVEFAVVPWTRVAAAASRGEPLVAVCGSGREEAAIVVRRGVALEDVRTLAVPQRGGMKELTADALIESLGWGGVEILRLPSGDGAILALVGQAAEAASMIEPYATLLERLGVGDVVRRTGDVWPGAPGCSLATSRRLVEESPELVQAVVAGFAEGAREVAAAPAKASAISAPRIGIHERFVLEALERNAPDVDALRRPEALAPVLARMQSLGYLDGPVRDFVDLRFLDAWQRDAGA